MTKFKQQSAALTEIGTLMNSYMKHKTKANLAILRELVDILNSIKIISDNFHNDFMNSTVTKLSKDDYDKFSKIISSIVTYSI